MTTATPVARPENAAALRRSRSRISARLRILGWYVALVAGAIAVGLFVQRGILLSQLNSNINAQLNQEISELHQLAAGRDPNTGQPFGRDVAAIFDTFLQRNVPEAGEAMFTLVDGQPYASTVAPLQLLEDPQIVATWAAISTPTRDELSTAAGPVRYQAVPLLDNDRVAGVFVVAVFLEERRAEVDHVVTVGGFVYGASFLVASVLAWIAAGRVLRPVKVLTAAARSISEDNWRERIPVSGDDEIVELARTFNEMLDRLEDAFAAQRRFIDDAGHELRTPITVIRGHLELLEVDPDNRAETIALVMDELDRMTRMVEDLLLLAKSETPDFLQLDTVDVGDLVQDIANKATALAPRDFIVEVAPRIKIVADRQRLTQALINLVRNAIEHTPASSPIWIGNRVAGASVEIWVRDAGPGIAAADQERIFERFARAGARRSDGAGLGLAIVKAIAEAHGGRVTVASRLGAGATFTLILPVDHEGDAV
ncbi:MAG: two-component sensor histidine kinase [Chloroflexi bacterium]|nr:MAG: two-component sensor histidine kinase [Chloroflexota bacterium]